MTNLIKHLKNTTEKKSKLVQLRVSESEKKLLDAICEQMSIRQNKLAYELLRFGLDQYIKENPEIEKQCGSGTKYETV